MTWWPTRRPHRGARAAARAMIYRWRIAALIDNASQMSGHPSGLSDRLIDCAAGDDRTVAAVEWDALGAGEARRLRELGLDEGVAVALLHRAPLGGTVACRIGRMTVAMRRHVAQAIQVAPIQVAPAIVPAE